MAGKLPPDTEKPVPEIESELTVTATLPLEVTVTGLVTAELTVTLPKESEVALRLNAGVAAFSCIAKLSDEEFALAVKVAVCEVLTTAAVAVKDAVEAPEATITLDGTVTELSLLATDTLMPPDGAAALNDREHVAVPAPVNEFEEHDSALIVGGATGADPLRLMEVVFVTDPFLAVRVAVCEEATGAMLAAKFAPVTPEATITEAGTVTALLLLARLTTAPPLGAAAVKVTVQSSDPAPFIEECAQLRPDRDAAFFPAPCSLTVPPHRLASLVEMVVTLICPVVSVADPGSKLTCTTILPPGGRVLGSVPAFTVNALLELLSWDNSTDVDSRFVIAILLLALVPTFTSPKSISVGFISTTTSEMDADPPGSAPQPESHRALSARAATAIVAARAAICRRSVLFDRETSGSPVEIFSSAKDEEVRNTCIGVT